MGTYFSKLSENFSEITGHYSAFIIAFLFIIILALSGHIFKFSDTCQLVINTSTTIITF